MYKQPYVFFAIDQWTACTADILTSHSQKNTGGLNNNNTPVSSLL